MFPLKMFLSERRVTNLLAQIGEATPSIADLNAVFCLGANVLHFSFLSVGPLLLGEWQVTKLLACFSRHQNTAIDIRVIQSLFKSRL